MYPGWITDKITDLVWGLGIVCYTILVSAFVFTVFYTITLGIMSIVYLLN